MIEELINEDLRELAAGKVRNAGGSPLPLIQRLAAEVIHLRGAYRGTLILALVLLVALIFCMASCSPEYANSTRIDGRRCQTTLVRPDILDAEIWTDCLDKDGHPVTIVANHTDAGGWGVLGAAAGIFAATR